MLREEVHVTSSSSRLDSLATLRLSLPSHSSLPKPYLLSSIFHHYFFSILVIVRIVHSYYFTNPIDNFTERDYINLPLHNTLIYVLVRYISHDHTLPLPSGNTYATLRLLCRSNHHYCIHIDQTWFCNIYNVKVSYDYVI